MAEGQCEAPRRIAEPGGKPPRAKRGERPYNYMEIMLLINKIYYSPKAHLYIIF